MKVQLKTYSPKYRDLTAGNIYRVIGIEAGNYRIMNDFGRPYLYPRRLFRAVDPSPSPDWQRTKGSEGEQYAYPPALAAPGFFEDYFDGKRRAMATLHSYLTAIAAAESDPPEKPRGRRRGTAA